MSIFFSFNFYNLNAGNYGLFILEIKPYFRQHSFALALFENVETLLKLCKTTLRCN